VEIKVSQSIFNR